MLRIRRVQPNDIFPVIALAFETLPERYNPSIFNQFYESFPEGFLVAVHHHTIIGFLIGVKSAPNTGRILMLSVKHTHRRQGVGTALLSQFLQEMHCYHIAWVDLEVRTSNQSAVMFYQTNGFLLQEILPHFYQNGENAYSMRKIL